jgi:Lon protease-like protein
MTSERQIPIFPLPVVVLFPDGRAPLHIFEPRYQQMMEATLTGEGVLGMVAVPQDQQNAMSGDPVVYPVGCAGKVSQYQRLPDGRFNLVLDATERFRILEEPIRPISQLYRSARVEGLPEHAPEAQMAELGVRRGEIMERLRELVERSGSGEASLNSGELEAKSHGVFTNNLCQALTLPTTEKQGLLEIDSILERAERLLGHLEFHLASLRSGSASNQVH